MAPVDVAVFIQISHGCNGRDLRCAIGRDWMRDFLGDILHPRTWTIGAQEKVQRSAIDLLEGGAKDRAGRWR